LFMTSSLRSTWNTAPIRSLAILPFENQSGDITQEYFSDGMTEVLVTELGKITGLRIPSRSSTARYKGTQKSIPEIARELNVEAVATGSAIRSGDRVRITLQLYRGETGENIWSENYERGYGEIVALQGTIARAITDQIKLKISSAEQISLTSRKNVDPQALDAYLLGLHLFDRAQNTVGGNEGQAWRDSIAALEKAIELEPNYVEAHATLALCYVYRALDNPKLWSPAKQAALRALQLDETNARAHGALATVAWRGEWDAVTAENEYKRAIELNPNVGDLGYPFYALFLSSNGRHEEAIDMMRRAESIDPFIINLKMNRGMIYLRAKQYDAAVQQFRRVIELSPDHVNTWFKLGVALACKGEVEEAIAVGKKGVKISGNPIPPVGLAFIYAKAGRRDDALKILNDIRSTTRLDGSSREVLDIAGVYGELGDNDEAFTWLETAYQRHLHPLVWLKTDPEFESLRGDPRYEEMLNRIGLWPSG